MGNIHTHLLSILTAVAFLGACAGLWLAALTQKEWVLYMAIAGFVAPFWCALAISTERILRRG